MQSAAADNKQRTGFWLSVVGILLLAVALRLINLMELPLYLDEAQHIPRAQNSLMGQPFVGDYRKFYLYQFLALYMPTGPEAAWISRASIAIVSVLGVGSVIALGRMLKDERAGLIGGLLMAVLPFAVFHGRVALADPLVAAYLAFALVLMVRLVQKPHPLPAVLLGITLGVAFLTKMTALPYLILPPITVLVLAKTWKGPRFWQAMGFSGLSIAAAVVVILLVYNTIARGIGQTLAETLFGRLLTTVVGSGGGAELFDLARWGQNLTDFWVMLRMYAGWGVILLLAASLLVFTLNRADRRPLLFLWGALLAVGAPILISPGIPTIVVVPRYFAPIVAPMAAIAGFTLIALVGRLRAALGAPSPVVSWAAAGILLVSIIPAMGFNGTLITNPLEARLYPSQRTNWVTGWGSGVGQGDIATAILDTHAAGDTALLLGYNKYILWQRSLVGSDLLTADYLGEDPEQAEQIAEALAQGRQVFFLTDSREDMSARPPYQAEVELVGEFATVMYGDLALFEVTGARGDLAEMVYTQRAPAFEQMEDDFAALDAALAAGGDHPLVMFPPGLAAPYTETFDRSAEPLTVSEWPADLETLTEVLTEDVPSGEVDVVLVDQAAVDPAQTVALSLHDTHYWLNSEFFGLLHHQRLVTGPADPSLADVGVTFERVIHLEQAAVVDTTAAPGGNVRVALAWRASQQVGDPYYIYAHILDEDGSLYAQNDHEAGGGLFPMQGWPVDTVQPDRFAIPLPEDMPAGEYALHVGIYHPTSGIRLPVTAGENTGPDYAKLATITVAE